MRNTNNNIQQPQVKWTPHFGQGKEEKIQIKRVYDE